jgi:hypothetical protein
MVMKKMILRKEIPDNEYTRICNLAEKQGVFVSCGDIKDKWILLNFKHELDFLVWIIGNSGVISTKKTE